jgi:hypothetical protein
MSISRLVQIAHDAANHHSAPHDSELSWNDAVAEFGGEMRSLTPVKVAIQCTALLSREEARFF